MKSKRAEEFIGDTYLVGHPAFPIRIDIKNDLVKAVELAEQDTEEQYQDDLHHYQLMMNDTCSEMIDERDEEITSYRKELEESKRREELACKVIDDQRKNPVHARQHPVFGQLRSTGHDQSAEGHGKERKRTDRLGCAGILPVDGGF